MSMVSSNSLRKGLILMVVNCVLYTQSISATEWRDDFDSKFSFAGFAPPAEFSDHRSNSEEKLWASGRSFNEENKVRYTPAVSKNPWKPVALSSYKKTFGGQRPWGNVPERKPRNKNSMKFYDQKFKQWSHRQGNSYRNDYAFTDPFMSYGRSPLPFYGAYGYPGSGYNSPLITPSIYPGPILGGAGFGAYPGGSYPYTGLSARPTFW